MRAGERAGELTQEQRCTTDAHLAGNHAGLEQLFRARVIAFLVEAGLLPLDRARMLRSWFPSQVNGLKVSIFDQFPSLSLPRRN